MRQILTLLLLFCWFFAGAIDYTLTASGTWSTSTIWSPNGVPGSVDNVTIPDPGSGNSFTVTLTDDVVINSLEFNGFYDAAGNIIRNVIKGNVSSRTLTINSTSIWRGGFLDDVELIIPSGVGLNLETSDRGLRNNAKITNGGTFTWNGGALYFYDNALIDNNNLFINNTAANLLYSPTNSSTLAFTNDGTFTSNSPAFHVTINFQNNGTLNIEGNIEGGFIRFLNQITNNGTINLNSTAATNHKLTNYTGSGTVHFGTNTTLEFDDASTVGTITGSSGTIAFVDKPSPNGSTITINQIIPSGIALDFSDARTVTLNVNQPLNNNATFILSNTVLNGSTSGKLSIQSGKTLTWEQGTIDISVTLEVAGGGNLLLTTSSEKKFMGSAQLSLASGSSTLKGIGTMSFSASQPALGGTIAPGLSPGTLTFSGNRTINGALAIEVDGASVDKLVVTGTLDLTDATLTVTELNSHPLPTGVEFTIVQASAITQNFSSRSGSVTLPPGYEIYYGSDKISISNGPLPVELTQFTALITDAGNRLHWETASETNSDWHIVERSSTGSSWEEISRLAAAGTSLETHTYDFEDLSLLPLSYYRLRTVDLDGSFEFSKTIVLQRSGGRHISLNTYPNPADSKLNVDIYSPEEQDADLLVADQFGRILHVEAIHAEEGLNSNELSVSDLPAGVYFIEVKTERSLSMQKFVKR